VKTSEPAVKRAMLPRHKVMGKAFCDALLRRVRRSSSRRSQRSEGGRDRRGGRLVPASTYLPFDGATAGDFDVTVAWSDPATGKSQIPPKYRAAGELRATVAADRDNHVTLDMKR